MRNRKKDLNHLLAIVADHMATDAVDNFEEETVVEVAVVATRSEVETHTVEETVGVEAVEAMTVVDIEEAEDKEEVVVVVVATEND